MKKIILMCILASITNTASAEWIRGVSTTITRVSSYGVGPFAGDIKFHVVTTVAGCEAGYYLRAADAVSKKDVLSIALSAFHSGAKVQFNGNDSPRWDGSPTENYCLVESIHLTK